MTKRLTKIEKWCLDRNAQRLDWYADLDLFEKQELLEGFTAQKEEEWHSFGYKYLEEADRLDQFTEEYYYEWLDFLEYNRKAAEETLPF